MAVLLWSLLFSLVISRPAQGATVTVFPRDCSDSGGNVTLNYLISRSEMASDTLYRLLPGTHCLSDFAYVRNLDNITLSGDTTDRGSVVITCTDRVGLAFLDIHSLTLEGLTISGCGAKGEDRLELLQQELTNRTLFFYQIRSTNSVAVAVGMATDLVVRAVELRETRGLGLLAVNLQGSTVLEDSSFSLNSPSFCYRLPLDSLGNVNLTESERVGGGAYFVFVDFTDLSLNTAASLQVSDTEFTNNSYCGLSAQIAVSEARERLVDRVGYSLGAGGGLTVLLAQTLYPTDLVVTGSLFKNNTSLLGGGVHLALFEGASGNNITISNCQFLRNGLSGDSIDSPQFPTQGAGLYLVRDMTHPLYQGNLLRQSQPNTITLQGCSLIGNRGSYSAAIDMLSLYRSRLQEDTVTLENCTLSNNEAIVGAAMYLGEYKQNGLQPGTKVVLRNIVITENRIYSDDSTGNIPATSKSDISGAVEIQAISVTFEGGGNVIANNSAAAIRSVSSVMYFYDCTTISNNSGSFGGGLSLIANSYVVLKNNSCLTLESNYAVVEGGALYVNLLALSPDINYHDCFLFFQEVDTICLEVDLCSDVESLNFTLTLWNNVAPLGSLMFGSTLDTCPWSPQLREKYHRSHVLDVMYRDMNDSFRFSTDPTSVTAVTTPSSRLVIHSPLSVSISPGEIFYLNVSGYDRLDQSLPILISSKPALSNPNISSKLGFSNFSFLDIAGADQNGALVPVIVTGQQNVSDVMVYLYATDSYSHAHFMVNLTCCRTGFEFHGGSCVCVDGLKDYGGIECNSTSMNLTLSNNWWAGPGPSKSLIVQRCISDFCSAGERQVKPPDFDLLCHHDYHRSGILCGSCQEGYSVQLGSQQCERCQDNYGLLLILFFAFGGVIIMFGVLFLHITVSEGYLNSILFYTNTLSIYVPILNTSNQNLAVFVVIAWFNLDFGIEQCFYDGMTTLDRVGLHLVFPFYLLLLMVLVTILSKKSRKLSWFFSRNKFSAAKMFATVLLMSYATLLGVCIELLSPISLRSVNGDTYLMWRSDPNQKYFYKLHAYLVVLACFLLLTVVLPLPILLMFPAIAFRTRLGVRLKPVLDAFWAPFKTKFRFFVGLRLILRVIPYTTAYVSQQPVNILFLGIFAVSMLFLQVTFQPFDGFFRNTLDTFFLANIIVLAMGALYFDIFVTANEEYRGYVQYHKEQFIYFTLFVTMAYIAILLVILWHIQHRFPLIRRVFPSIISFFRRRSKLVESSVRETTPLTSHADSESEESHEGEEMTDRWSVKVAKKEGPTAGGVDKGSSPPVVVNYSVLREPLLEEGEADLVPVYRIQ